MRWRKSLVGTGGGESPSSPVKVGLGRRGHTAAAPVFCFKGYIRYCKNGLINLLQEL